MEQKSNHAADTNLSDPDRILTNLEFVELGSTLLENSLSKKMRRTFEITDTDAKSPQERSLKRNQWVSGDTEKPSTSTGFTSHLEPGPETTKKMKTDDSRSEAAEDDDSRMTPGDKLGEDELTVIFSNTWLSAQDLLNFRLVSKKWRDAATTTLRQRDGCVVELWPALDFGLPYFCKSVNKLRNKDKLSQLTELISISPKFPATDFRIHISRMSFTSYTLFQDLLNFFKLHGDKIKTLRYDGKITARCLLDILLYAPTLESLDLSKAVILECDEEDGGEGNALKWTSTAVSLKSLNIRLFVHFRTQYKLELFRLLLSSLSKLGCIENVTLDSLQMVLTEGKGHLIRSFECVLWDAHWVSASQLATFVSLNPKPQLSKVTLNLEDRWPSSVTELNSLNEFIKYCKDTVQTLELLCHYYQHAWDPLLNIPPMKNLKSFTLKLTTSRGVIGIGGGHLVSDCRMCQAEKSKMFVGIRGRIFQFQDGISAQNYFPRLINVSLHSILSKLNEVSPMSFFSFKSDTDHADGTPAQSGFFPKVDILEINRIDVGSRPRPAGTCHCHYRKETSSIPEVFPNIRILKFKCGEVSNLTNDLWTLCPNVEFMEVSGITSCSSGGRDVEMSRFVDKVFTGSPDRMLRRLRRSAAGHPSKADDSEEFEFDCRITDLRRLRELKLKFVGKWSTEFASSVTGVYAFSKMENTKFLISYDPFRILTTKFITYIYSYGSIIYIVL